MTDFVRYNVENLGAKNVLMIIEAKGGASLLPFSSEKVMVNCLIH